VVKVASPARCRRSSVDELPARIIALGHDRNCPACRPHSSKAANIPWAKKASQRRRTLSLRRFEKLYDSKGINGKTKSSPTAPSAAQLPYLVRSKYLRAFNQVRNYDGSWTEWGNLIGAPIVNETRRRPAPAGRRCSLGLFWCHRLQPVLWLSLAAVLDPVGSVVSRLVVGFRRLRRTAFAVGRSMLRPISDKDSNRRIFQQAKNCSSGAEQRTGRGEPHSLRASPIQISFGPKREKGRRSSSYN